jgi:tetratricopeptide (TPR) repeat protein
MDKFDAGDYWSVGSDGPAILRKEPGNNQLRMMVAESLAWTGRYTEAIKQYRMLSGTPLSDSAALGMANVYRWNGRPDLASPLYQQVLASQPGNPDALDGLDRINRERCHGTGAPCTSDDTEENTGPPASADAARLRDKFYAGEYWSVGSDGLDTLKKEPGNNELRMMVADSLAWTGRYPEAISQYQMLAGTALADSAALGMANAYRWNGWPDLATPLYLQILTSQPDNRDALDGLDRTKRELRPRTSVTLGRKTDSNSVTQNAIEISHYWRGDNLAVKYELSLNASRYTLSSVRTRQRELNFSVEHAEMAMAPRLDLSFQQEPANNAFASLRLKLHGAPDLHATIGRVNWGNMVFQPQALLDGLVATQIGVDGSLITRPGTISAAHNDYQVSDGNQVQDSSIRFSPSWRPLGADFRYYIGLSGRIAKRNMPEYWSPDMGYLSTDIGFTNEWSMSNGDYSIYGQRGFGAGGEALNSYNLGFAAKRYLDRDWAATLGAGLLENLRTDAYRSNYLTVGIERLW